jgi:cytochrome o ubiquinol oxidase subunit 2
MSEIHKDQKHRGPSAWDILFALALLGLLIGFLLRGKNVALFNPKGIIAQQQHNLITSTLTVLLAVAIPSLFLLYFVAWKYRDTNPKVQQATHARHGKLLVTSIWLIPTVVMLYLVSVMWPATHRLAPQNSIAANTKPLVVQVISLRWKWLFIYPEQHIASLNFVQLPVNTPVTFEMTADETPMSSFWIPNLGGQLYTMTSHVNRLNLMAETIGDYPGSSAEINGPGFAGMKFTARASSSQDFDQWVNALQQSPDVLNTSTYDSLLEPSEYNSSKFYASPDPNIYANVLRKYEGPGGHTH